MRDNEDGKPFRSPYPCYSLLREFDGAWMIASTAYAILDSPELVMALGGKADATTVNTAVEARLKGAS